MTRGLSSQTEARKFHFAIWFLIGKLQYIFKEMVRYIYIHGASAAPWWTQHMPPTTTTTKISILTRLGRDQAGTKARCSN
jgi:hypothetical protein